MTLNPVLKSGRERELPRVFESYTLRSELRKYLSELLVSGSESVQGTVVLVQLCAGGGARVRWLC